jgi:hypothetical protein
MGRNGRRCRRPQVTDSFAPAAGVEPESAMASWRWETGAARSGGSEELVRGHREFPDAFQAGVEDGVHDRRGTPAHRKLAEAFETASSQIDGRLGRVAKNTRRGTWIARL